MRDKLLDEHSELRRALNTERFGILCDSRGRVVTRDGIVIEKPIIEIVARFSGVVRPDLKGKLHDSIEQGVRFNLALDPFVTGVLPHSSLRLVAWAVVSLFCALVVLAPLLRQLLIASDRFLE